MLKISIGSVNWHLQNNELNLLGVYKRLLAFLSPSICRCVIALHLHIRLHTLFSSCRGWVMNVGENVFEYGFWCLNSVRRCLIYCSGWQLQERTPDLWDRELRASHIYDRDKFLHIYYTSVTNGDAIGKECLLKILEAQTWAFFLQMNMNQCLAWCRKRPFYEIIFKPIFKV